VKIQLFLDRQDLKATLAPKVLKVTLENKVLLVLTVILVL
jgi:hypothetical protein